MGVKNRLPPEFVGHAVEPHLTEEEVQGEGAQAFQGTLEGWGDMTTDNLGPFCCCDLAHTNGICGNCGPKFPHGSFNNNLYMTPMWCNSLARLSFSVSSPA